MAAHDPAQLAGSNRLVLRIDHKHFPEILRQILMIAQIIDQLSNRHMLRYCDQIALHDTPGGFLGIGQRILDRRAVFGVEFGKDGLLVRLFHILDNRDGVIGVELPCQIGKLGGGQGIDNVFADIIVDLGQHLGAHQVAKRNRQRTTPL